MSKPSKKTAAAGGSLLTMLLAGALLLAQHFGWLPTTDPSSEPANPSNAGVQATPPPPTVGTEARPTRPQSTNPQPVQPNRAEPLRPTVRNAEPTPAADGPHFITQLQQRGATDTPVTATGTISRVLPDDNEGSRHQRFLVTLSDGHEIKVSHNIDLAPRIPHPKVGDRLTFKGDFESNRLGGVVHWTHRDPRNRHPHGYLEHHNKRYE
ncbi:MAG: DUF3465 domain-containing protein [Planctomycetota bacterium]